MGLIASGYARIRAVIDDGRNEALWMLAKAWLKGDRPTHVWMYYPLNENDQTPAKIVQTITHVTGKLVVFTAELTLFTRRSVMDYLSSEICEHHPEIAMSDVPSGKETYVFHVLRDTFNTVAESTGTTETNTPADVSTSFTLTAMKRTGILAFDRMFDIAVADVPRGVSTVRIDR